MRINLNGRNITITQAIKDYVDEKIGKIAKHYDQIIDIEVTLGVIKNPSVAENHLAEVTCKIAGSKICVSEEAESMYASIDLVADKLNRQVKKHKEKLLKSKNKNDSIRTSGKEEDDETEELEEVTAE